MTGPPESWYNDRRSGEESCQRAIVSSKRRSARENLGKRLADLDTGRISRCAPTILGQTLVKSFVGFGMHLATLIPLRGMKVRCSDLWKSVLLPVVYLLEFLPCISHRPKATGCQGCQDWRFPTPDKAPAVTERTDKFPDRDRV